MFTTNTILGIYLIAHAVFLGMLGLAGLWLGRHEEKS